MLEHLLHGYLFAQVSEVNLGPSGRRSLGRWLDGAGAGSTVELAVVTTFSAGKSRLWPTAFSLAEGVASSAAGGAGGDDWRHWSPSQGKCFSSKGRLVFQTA